jgi:WD40-like Beta Propeller Repeat
VQRSLRHGPGSAPPFTLAYTSYRGGLSAIYTMNADGTGKQRLTAAQLAFQGQPAYSPDGSKIAYVCGNFELCVMNADGSGQGRLTTSRWPKTWEYVDRPTWSPDGVKIAFASNADGKFHVYVINADGTGLHRLSGTSWNDDDPAWSPDGTTIAFDRYRSWCCGVSAIYVMNADGTQPRRLAAGHLPSWSPDGSKIVSHDYDAGDDNLHLFLMTATGSGQRQLTSGSCDEIDPAFSPDGSTLAFDWDCRGRLGIALKVGRRIHRISAPQRGFDFHPAWRPTATGGPATTPIAPPSTPTGDALLASSYFQWGAQVTIDILPAGDVIFSPPGPRMLRRILADDRHALAAFRAARPETAKGKRLQRTATAAFRLLSAAATQYLLCDRAAARGKTTSSDRYRDAGERLLELSDQKFIAADNIGTLPYPY